MKYVPKQGDLVWLTFSPSKGHEQSGRRPALVVSPEEYNNKTGLALVCPITSTSKGYKFEVVINTELVKGVILSDHVRNVSWIDRKAEYICAVPREVTSSVQSKVVKIVTALD